MVDMRKRGEEEETCKYCKAGIEKSPVGIVPVIPLLFLMTLNNILYYVIQQDFQLEPSNRNTYASEDARNRKRKGMLGAQ